MNRRLIPMYINLVLQLGIPLAAFFALRDFSSPVLVGPLAPPAFSVLLNGSFVLAYLFYAASIVRVNQRRFPRVLWRAIAAISVPLLVEVILGMIGEVPSRLWVPVLGTHYFGGLLLAMVFESLQRSRVRAMPLHPVLIGVAFAASAFAISLLHLLTFPLYLSARVPYLVSWQAAAWAIGFVLIAYQTFYQSGKKLYAARGYRPNAAVIVMNTSGEVLLCERNDRPGTIQTVQGGIDPGETPEQAARRELVEELGVWPDEYEFKAALLEAKRYDWSSDIAEKLKHTGYKGQEQYFFLVEVPDDVVFDLHYHVREFRKVWFDSPEQLLKLSWSKKRPGIEAALKGFGLIE